MKEYRVSLVIEEVNQVLVRIKKRKLILKTPSLKTAKGAFQVVCFGHFLRDGGIPENNYGGAQDPARRVKPEKKQRGIKRLFNRILGIVWSGG